MQMQIAYEGFVMKRGNSFPWSWKERYLMVWNDGVAKYSDKANSDKQTNAFHVTEIEEIEISDLAHNNNSGFGFVIKTNEREWYLSVNSDSDRQTWMERLVLVIRFVTSASSIASLLKEVENDKKLSIQTDRNKLLRLANELALMNQIKPAQKKYLSLLEKYPDWQVLNESYEYFLAHYCNCIDLAEESFVKRIKIVIVPPSICNDPEYFKLEPLCQQLKFGYFSNISLINSYSKDDSMNNDDNSNNGPKISLARHNSAEPRSNHKNSKNDKNDNNNNNNNNIGSRISLRLTKSNSNNGQNNNNNDNNDNGGKRISKLKFLNRLSVKSNNDNNSNDNNNGSNNGKHDDEKEAPLLSSEALKNVASFKAHSAMDIMSSLDNENDLNASNGNATNNDNKKEYRRLSEKDKKSLYTAATGKDNRDTIVRDSTMTDEQLLLSMDNENDNDANIDDYASIKEAKTMETENIMEEEKKDSLNEKLKSGLTKRFHGIDQCLFLRIKDGCDEAVLFIINEWKNRQKFESKCIFTLEDLEKEMSKLFKQCLKLKNNVAMRRMFQQMRRGKVADMKDEKGNDIDSKEFNNGDINSPTMSDEQAEQTEQFRRNINRDRHQSVMSVTFGTLGDISFDDLDDIVDELVEKLQLASPSLEHMTNDAAAVNGKTNNDDSALDTASMFSLDSDFISGLVDPSQGSFFPTLESIFGGNHEDYPSHLDMFGVLLVIWSIRRDSMNHILDKEEKMHLKKARMEQIAANETKMNDKCEKSSNNVSKKAKTPKTNYSFIKALNDTNNNSKKKKERNYSKRSRANTLTHENNIKLNHRKVLIKTLSILYSFVYECFRNVPTRLLKRSNIKTKNKDNDNVIELYRDRILTLFALAYENDPYEVRFSLCVQALSLISSQLLSFDDKRAIILFLKENNWVSGLNGENLKIIFGNLLLCLKYELSRIDKEFDIIYNEFEDYNKIEKAFIVEKRGRLCRTQNNDAVLGMCGFAPKNSKNGKVIDANGYSHACYLHKIEKMKQSQINELNDFDFVYLDYIIKVAKKIQRPFYNLIIFSLKPYYVDFEAIPVKSFENGYKELKYKMENTHDNIIDDANLADRMLNFLRFFVVFDKIDEMINAFNLLIEKSKNPKSVLKVISCVNYLTKRQTDTNSHNNNNNDNNSNNKMKRKSKNKNSGLGNGYVKRRNSFTLVSNEEQCANLRWISIYCIMQHPKQQHTRLICELRFVMQNAWLQSQRYCRVLETFSNILDTKEIFNVCASLEQKRRPTIPHKTFEWYWNEEILPRIKK